MSVIEEKLPYLDKLVLGHGSHQAPNNGLVDACVMEAVSYIAGEPWSDRPECASGVLTSFLIGLNDRWNDENRQLLKPYIVRLVGTNTGPDDEQTRRLMIREWLVHEYAPAVFRALDLTAEAEEFEGLAAITDEPSWQAARRVIYRVRDEQGERRRKARAVAADAVAAAAADAVADADADADAAADAVAVAVAAAAAVAEADAVAVAVAAAVAVAEADADAVAVADADADAAADGYKHIVAEAVKAANAKKGYWDRYYAARDVFAPYYRSVWEERFGSLGLKASVLGLVDRLIDVSRKVPA